MKQLRKLFIIPARKGSKGIPNKNTKILGGKPLVQHSMEYAKEMAQPDDVICVTTDDDKVIEVAKSIGVNIDFKRPDYLAEDTSGMYEVLIHALDYYTSLGEKFDTIVLLQPTSPFRLTAHLSEMVENYASQIGNELDMLVSVTVTNSNPYYVLFEEDGNGWLEKSKKGNFARRQDCPEVYQFNGSIYLINPESLRTSPLQHFQKIAKYQMDKVYALDLDNLQDWEFAEFLLEKGKLTL
jgi:CMP-N,N'-diacetyllegionaminic acid synthase